MGVGIHIGGGKGASSVGASGGGIVDWAGGGAVGVGSEGYIGGVAGSGAGGRASRGLRVVAGSGAGGRARSDFGGVAGSDIDGRARSGTGSGSRGGIDGGRGEWLRSKGKGKCDDLLSDDDGDSDERMDMDTDEVNWTNTRVERGGRWTEIVDHWRRENVGSEHLIGGGRDEVQWTRMEAEGIARFSEAMDDEHRERIVRGGCMMGGGRDQLQSMKMQDKSKGQRIEHTSHRRRVEHDDSERTMNISMAHEEGTQDEVEEVDGVRSETIHVKRKGRGFSTLKFFKHKGENPHKLEWNKYGQVIGHNAQKLRAACAYYARCSWLWPVHRKWNDMPESSWIHTLELLKDEFDLDGHPNAYKFVFELLHARCKSWKSRIKMIWLKNRNKPEVLKEKVLEDPRINEEQFANLVKQWSTSDSEAMALINQNNRKKMPLDHRCGRRALATCRDDFEKEKNREPTEVDIMKIMYPNETKVDEIEEHINKSQHINPHLSSKELMAEAYSHFLGTGKKEYVHFVGAGHEKSCKRSEMEKLQAALQNNRDKQEYVKNLENVIVSLKLKVKQQKTSMKEMRLWVQQLSQHVGFNFPHPYAEDAPDFSRASGNGSRFTTSGRSKDKSDFHNGGIPRTIPSSNSQGHFRNQISQSRINSLSSHKGRSDPYPLKNVPCSSNTTENSLNSQDDEQS